MNWDDRTVWICQRCHWVAPDDCTCRGNRPRPQPGVTKVDRQTAPKPRGPITRSRR